MCRAQHWQLQRLMHEESGDPLLRLSIAATQSPLQLSDVRQQLNIPYNSVGSWANLLCIYSLGLWHREKIQRPSLTQLAVGAGFQLDKK